MSTQKIKANELETLFRNHLHDDQTYFVFSTDVVKNSWIDWIVTHPQESGASAVALERFVAWDKFKSEYVKGTEDCKTSIPAILRKFYIQNLIRENSENPFFKRIINPQFKDDADSFTSWITRLLPSLKQWHELKAATGTDLDEEDQDYETLYLRYSAFLEKNSMFEPAWIQSDFSTLDRKFIIIFPEILEDWCDYEETLSENENITLVLLDTSDTEETGVPCYKYSDSRKELRRTILQIRQLADSGVDYQNMSLNVPDLETYRPYLERELEKYCVPYVIRAGIGLVNNGPAQIFSKILNCYNNNFSYDSIRSLILDDYIPWKEEYSALRESFVREGNRMRCLCSFEENSTTFDIWDKALKQSQSTYREHLFYLDLKNEINAICEASSFDGIHKAWDIFNKKFLCKENFSSQANNIISRCIVHLNELSDVETKYFETNQIILSSPYAFFISELQDKTYTPQSSLTGINVYPYKLAAAARIKYQFVIDASQVNLERPFHKLAFLNGEKRKQLGLLEKDKQYNPSNTFIDLYSKYNDSGFVSFSYAENSFAGFAIAHNHLKLVKDSNNKVIENPLEELDSQDFILQEKNLFLNKKTDSFKFSEAQKKQFEKWYKTNYNRFEKEHKQEELNTQIQDRIKEVLIINRNKHQESSDLTRLVLTQTDMKKFFQCPRLWLFSQGIKLQEDSLSLSLMKKFDMGNIHHRILELFIKDYIATKTPLPVVKEDGKFENEEELHAIVKEKTLLSINDPKHDFHDAPLVLLMLNSQADAITQTIMDFLHTFLSSEHFGGFYAYGAELNLNHNNPELEWNYYGKIDCLLASGPEDDITKTWAIIDYKNTSSSFPKTNEITAVESEDEALLGDFQMPLYITLIQNNKTGTISNAEFWAIKDTESKVVIGQTKKQKLEMEDFEPTMKVFVDYAKTFNEKITSMNLEPSDSGIKPYENCMACSYKDICRYSFTVGAKDIKRGN